MLEEMLQQGILWLLTEEEKEGGFVLKFFPQEEALGEVQNDSEFENHKQISEIPKKTQDAINLHGEGFVVPGGVYGLCERCIFAYPDKGDLEKTSKVSTLGARKDSVFPVQRPSFCPILPSPSPQTHTTKVLVAALKP